jgi:P-type conjugative transfer protein TrbJ
MTAFQQTMTVQAQITENIATDTSNLASLSNRSQSAQGSLQATQATNQLLALIAKQQLQMQSMMAAQYRAGAVRGRADPGDDRRAGRHHQISRLRHGL